MVRPFIMATAWKNSAHPSSLGGYGLKIPKSERDAHFKREWKVVELRFPDTGDVATVSIDKDSFWSDACRELISKIIGQWLVRNRLAPWPKRMPPTIQLLPKGENAFDVLKKLEI